MFTALWLTQAAIFLNWNRNSLSSSQSFNTVSFAIDTPDLTVHGFETDDAVVLWVSVGSEAASRSLSLFLPTGAFQTDFV